MSSRRARARSAPTIDVLTFEVRGRQRAVDLRAPVATFQGGEWRVSLMDLWVATLLQEDVLDLVFELITPPRSGITRALTDGLVFARGFVGIDSRELWWKDPMECPLHGAPLAEVLVHATGRRIIALAPAPAQRSAIERRLADYADRYPNVVWREKEPAEAVVPLRSIR